MTSMTDLIAAALAAANLFREGDTPEQSQIRDLVRAADEYREGYAQHGHQDDCAMCLVRALTEGAPPTWMPKEAGEKVTGVVLKIGEFATDNWGSYRIVDLWQGGTQRIRIRAYSSTLRHALDQADAKVGDTLTVWYDGERESKSRPLGRTIHYKAYTANAQRGH